jgi:hypothetical protein
MSYGPNNYVCMTMSLRRAKCDTRSFAFIVTAYLKLTHLVEYKSLSEQPERVDLSDLSDQFDDTGPPTRDDSLVLNRD